MRYKQEYIWYNGFKVSARFLYVHVLPERKLLPDWFNNFDTFIYIFTWMWSTLGYGQSLDMVKAWIWLKLGYG